MRFRRDYPLGKWDRTAGFIGPPKLEGLVVRIRPPRQASLTHHETPTDPLSVNSSFSTTQHILKCFVRRFVRRKVEVFEDEINAVS